LPLKLPPASKSSLHFVELHQNPHRPPAPATHTRIVGIFSRLFATNRKSQVGDDDAEGVSLFPAL
jgi:hypothetical protein